MAAAIVSAFFDYDEVLSKNTKMLNFNNTFSGPPSSAGVPPSPPPTGPLLDRRAVGSPPSSSSSSSSSCSSAGGIHQRRHSANALSLPPPPGARDPRLRERCYSETGDRLRAPGAGGGGGGTLAAIAAASGLGPVNSSRYKTELCRPFEEHGACKYGEKCQFAHGHQELRSLSRHPKYKTELCRTFHSIGFCPYGPRCHFIHNAEERCGPVPPNSGTGRMPPPPTRPRLQHSLSFAGFPSAPSLTPPPSLAADWPSSDPFALPSQELAQLFGSGLANPPVLRLPTVPCPPDSLSDQEGYQSSLGSHSGSESPVMDAARRLPIFSWLSISDD
ncbi:mRNA decay activator protein ZFP36L1-like [Alosa pseudoharengus]|uniref:mRNA decay activator protein ZFP36L1-like n=1 Tax=Alosa pseudoharengus TaxID=34774 RepID=UPI003F891A29